jgi:hypothetical protein
MVNVAYLCLHSKCKQLLEKLKREQQSALRTNTYQTTVRGAVMCTGMHIGRRLGVGADDVHIVDINTLTDVPVHALQSCPICLEDFAPDSAGPSSGKASAAGPSSGKAAADSAPLLEKLGGNADGNAAGAGEQPVSRKPLALPCGHRFCTPCISKCDHC